MIPEAEPNVRLHPCPICGRTFHPSALEKHRVICEKTKAKKRKVFDSSKQRAGAGPEIVKRHKNVKNSSKPQKKSNWKEIHEEFIKTIRAAKKGTKGEDDNNSNPVKPSIPIGYTACPTCERNFSQKAADRHIAWCKEQKNKIKLDAKSTEASVRLKARTKYQAPVPGKKCTNGTSDGGRMCESAKIIGRPIAQVKSSKAKSSLPLTNTSNGEDKPDVNSNLNLSGSHRLAVRKEQLDKKLVLPLKDIRRNINVGSHEKRSPNVQNLNSRSSYADRSVLMDSYSSFNSKSGLRCSKPFGTMAPRTVPGVRTNSISSREFCVSNGPMSRRYNSLNSSSFNQNKLVRKKSPDDEIDEIDIGRNNSNHSRRRSSSPGSSFRSGGAFTSYKQNINNKLYHGSDSDTRGSTSGSDSSLPPLSIPTSGELYRLPRFCHDCGTKYPIATAKFCCECGLRRFSIDSNTV